MNKQLLFFITAIFLISFASAVEQESSLGTFKQGECIKLLQTCADCTYVNFTSVSYPNSTLAQSNVPATKIGSVFNYTYCNTKAIGEYTVTGIGDIGGIDTVFAYGFDITSTGDNTSFSMPLLLIILSLTFMVLAYIMEENIMGFVSGCLFFITGIYLIVYGYNGVWNDYSRMVGYVAIGLGLLLTISSAWKFGESEGGTEEQE